MARRISFAMTIPQFLDATKTVTRRMGFTDVRVGDEMIAVEKCMGLNKGERHVELGRLVVTDVRREKLSDMTDDDCAREGFPELDSRGFVEMFCKSMRCDRQDMVTRIEFRKLDTPGEWIDGGANHTDIVSGTRVRYYPVRDEPAFKLGTAQQEPWRNANKWWVVHVDLDDGGTVYSAHLRHLEIIENEGQS